MAYFCVFQSRKLCYVETRRWLFLLGVVAVTYLLFQSLLILYGNALHSLVLDSEVEKQENNVLPFDSSSKSSINRDPHTVNALDMFAASALVGKSKNVQTYSLEVEIGKPEVVQEIGWTTSKSLEVVDKLSVDSSVDQGSSRKRAFELENKSDIWSSFPKEQLLKPNEESVVEVENPLPKELESGNINSEFSMPSLLSLDSSTNVVHEHLKSFISNGSSSAAASQQKDLVSSDSGNISMSPRRKELRCNVPPKTITSIQEMNRILLRNRASSRSMRPRWASENDREIIAVKSEIEHASVVRDSNDLYAPIFRNISMFRRSYELMERTLRVYVYRDGKKPIFHQPILKGLYASEGWFMKLMEGNKQFIAKDPRKAHLFYMPFSSRMLESIMYVKNSHNRTNLRQYLKNYSEQIAAKYPFWNRTGGADHFLVACHDWAPYETRHHMERCIKALCNADVTAGFKIGRDISLPETYVRAARNPQRDLGGKPPHRRPILAFYAGNMHGYLRPILLMHWKDRDPTMKIFGPMPPGVASKMNYIEHMKSSRYCICPKGYEVNSPRVVEAIFYECVPVIISDNFVPPFFEVLNWDAFSVILAENDIPNLKEILLSIPEEKYLALQLGVRKAQKHFLWHAKPLKFDLFHMTLHSIWYNRVFQIKLR